jgi:hypothetical protein
VPSYSKDPVIDAAIRAVVAHEPKFRALRILAAKVCDEALGEYAENGTVTRPLSTTCPGGGRCSLPEVA